jgi:hypothetical protein
MMTTGLTVVEQVARVRCCDWVSAQPAPCLRGVREGGRGVCRVAGSVSRSCEQLDVARKTTDDSTMRTRGSHRRRPSTASPEGSSRGRGGTGRASRGWLRTELLHQSG